MVTTMGRTAHTTKRSMLGMIAVWGGGGAERTNDLCKGGGLGVIICCGGPRLDSRSGVFNFYLI